MIFKVKVYTVEISANLYINFRPSFKAFFNLLIFLISQTVQPPRFFQETPDFA